MAERHPNFTRPIPAERHPLEEERINAGYAVLTKSAAQKVERAFRTTRGYVAGPHADAQYYVLQASGYLDRRSQERQENGQVDTIKF